MAPDKLMADGHRAKSLSENRLQRGGQAHFAPKAPQNEPVPDSFRTGSEARRALPPGGARSSRSGFTALEMLVAAVVISVLAAVAVTSMSTGQVQNLRAVTGILVSDLEYARSLAVQYNTQWSVQFDAKNNAYSLVFAGSGAQPYFPVNPRGRGDGPSATYLVALQTLGQSSTGDNGVRLAGAAFKQSQQNTTTITFGPLGNLIAAQNEDVVIWLTTGTGSSLKMLRLTVSCITGQVWVDEPAMFTSGSQVFK
jgi:prepilin-type N-terminal cleavage/methylation domain-containing protein